MFGETEREKAVSQGKQVLENELTDDAMKVVRTEKRLRPDRWLILQL